MDGMKLKQLERTSRRRSQTMMFVGRSKCCGIFCVDMQRSQCHLHYLSGGNQHSTYVATRIIARCNRPRNMLRQFQSESSGGGTINKYGIQNESVGRYAPTWRFCNGESWDKQHPQRGQSILVSALVYQGIHRYYAPKSTMRELINAETQGRSFIIRRSHRMQLQAKTKTRGGKWGRGE